MVTASEDDTGHGGYEGQYDGDLSAVEGEDIVIVGSGFAGLSTACYLADAGANVTVLEKNEQLGGRASRLEKDGFTFDMGPSWYLMPDVFERFFGHFGKSPDDYYSLSRLDPHYRIFFKDGDQVDLVPDVEANKELFEQYEQGAGEALERYLDKSEYTYNVGMEHFVYTDRPACVITWISTCSATRGGCRCSARCRATSRTTSNIQNSSRSCSTPSSFWVAHRPTRPRSTT